MALVTTIYGDMEDSLLEKRVGKEEDNDKILTWTEYWQKAELVHRSVDVYLKRGIDFGLEAAGLI